MARPKKATKVGLLGLPGPRKQCPFSGDELRIVSVATSAAGHPVKKFQVRGTGWVSTKLFDSREEAEWFFSHDHGVEPKMKNPYRRVEVVGEVEPPDPAVEDAQRLERHHLKLADDAMEALK